MAELRIKLQTDYELHNDFEYIEGSLIRPDKPWKGSQRMIHQAPPKLSGGGPAIVMGFNKVKKGRLHHLYLRLLDKNGASVAFRLMHVTLKDKRECLDVVINKEADL